MQMIVMVLTFFLLVTGCSNKGGPSIELKNKHLEEVPAGNWLKMFNLDYNSGKEIKIQITEKLRNEGILFDRYIGRTDEGRDNGVLTSIWNFKGYTIQEEYYGECEEIRSYKREGKTYREWKVRGGEGGGVWITIIFKEPKPYSELLPDHYKDIEEFRIEHTATIESKKDRGRRLFLFGYGKYCNRISLF